MGVLEAVTITITTQVKKMAAEPQGERHRGQGNINYFPVAHYEEDRAESSPKAIEYKFHCVDEKPKPRERWICLRWHGYLSNRIRPSMHFLTTGMLFQRGLKCEFFKDRQFYSSWIYA